MKILLGVVGVLVVFSLINAFFVNRQTEPAKAGAGRVVEVPGGDMHVEQSGRGPAIVLLHGWTAASDWWDRVTPALRKDHRVVRVDLLGHGDSEKPRDGYTMNQQADRVAAALAAIKVHKATIVGHSTGGEVAIAFSKRHPDLTRKLVVVDSEPNADFTHVDALASLSLKPIIGQDLWRITPDSAVKDGLRQAFATDSVPVPEAFVEDFRKLTFSSYKKTFDESNEYVEDGSLIADLTATATRKPVLIIFGAKDRLIDAKKAIPYYREKVPSAQTEVIAGAGHSPMWEKPAQTSSLILKFAR